jgi:hypothetical protein
MQGCSFQRIELGVIDVVCFAIEHDYIAKPFEIVIDQRLIGYVEFVLYAVFPFKSSVYVGIFAFVLLVSRQQIERCFYQIVFNNKLIAFYFKDIFSFRTGKQKRQAAVDIG